MSFPNESDTTLIAIAAERFGRHPVEYGHDADGLLFMVFDPPLTTEEQARLEQWKGLIRSAVKVSPEEWEALVPVIASARAHRTRTNAQWSAMTAAQRDTALIDWNRNLTDVLRALLRD